MRDKPVKVKVLGPSGQLGYDVDLARVSAEITPVTWQSTRRLRRPRFSMLDTDKTMALIGQRPSWQDPSERYMALRFA
jgi:dTDP-4-dehydrorhamnose reductase